MHTLKDGKSFVCYFEIQSDEGKIYVTYNQFMNGSTYKIWYNVITCSLLVISLFYYVNH